MKQQAKQALNHIFGTIYGHYAVRIDQYIDQLEKQVEESKKTEEKAVGMLGAAGLEMAPVLKERNHYQAAYKAEGDRRLEAEVKLAKVSEENLRLAKHDQRLQAAFDSLRKENEELDQEITELKNAKTAPVVLPAEIAAALEEVKKDCGTEWGDLQSIAWSIPRNPRASESGAMRLLHEYANRFHTFDLVDALRYGYKVEKPEPTPEVKFAVAVQEVLNAGHSTVMTAVKINDLAKAYEQEKQAK